LKGDEVRLRLDSGRTTAGTHHEDNRTGRTWSEIAEIRISPVRGGNARTTQRRVVAFLVNDPQEAVTRSPTFAQKQARRSVDAYGTPVSVTDQLLERTAEDSVGAAAAFTSAPLRRFG
jgi:hypothetical protein